MDMLGVLRSASLEAYGAVSEPVAGEMAVRSALDAIQRGHRRFRHGHRRPWRVGIQTRGARLFWAGATRRRNNYPDQWNLAQSGARKRAQTDNATRAETAPRQNIKLIKF